MKNKIFAMILSCPVFLFGASACTLAEGAPGLGNTFYGPTNCNGGSVDSINVVGPLDVENTTINSVTVNGNVSAESATINALTLSNGELRAQDSTFGTITASGNIYLDNSRVQNITINDTSGLDGSYAIYIDDTSVVTGNIVFSQGNGTVYETAGAQVLGTITGGQVVNQNSGTY